jgi:hypothetical protein
MCISLSKVILPEMGLYLTQILCMKEHSSAEARVHVNFPDSSREDHDGGEGSSVVERGESHEKRTRFSLSHDEGSIGK